MERVVTQVARSESIAQLPIGPDSMDEKPYALTSDGMIGQVDAGQTQGHKAGERNRFQVSATRGLNRLQNPQTLFAGEQSHNAQRGFHGGRCWKTAWPIAIRAGKA